MSLMPNGPNAWMPLLWAGVLFVLHLVTVVRALTRANRTPASRVAWVATILLLPVGGVIAYFLLGETNIGRGRFERLRETVAALRMSSEPVVSVPPDAAPLVDMARSINGLPAVSGNRIRLLGDPLASPGEPMRDPKAAMDVLIADIEAAREHVHIAFYIWLQDGTGTRVAQAVAAAAKRGVTCRVMVDALGSRAFHGCPLWRQMAAAGVQLLATLDDVNRIWHLPFSRVDLRDHRKLVVIDNRIGYCGSQNCADPEFRVKAKFAPWVDVLLRCEGPVVRQLQALFLSGWIPEHGEPGLEALTSAEPVERFADGGIAQVFETGPVTRHNAMSDMFVACMYAARSELIITTPYFVPDEAMLRALCAAPRRGVKTTIIFPERNDSWLVGNASSGNWADLLACGVEVHLYPLGLLHSKTLTLDGHTALVGSANMDRRSLELNFENNLLIVDPAVTASVRERQMGYLSVSRLLAADEVQHWSLWRRLVQNTVGMMAPVL
ncbi:cardiolipin synthase [Ottowia sp. GY511]|uniref:Cardiolipin synthase n=1 Tax=Ottowia flava TaxID=2675430 RepID=A0ABW4KQU2_9BURK|nr:cardiolipin synthase [Ottowia sp. GY511]TXK28357.1 cardiolipin synthase [Ottowia sp. GY511]